MRRIRDNKTIPHNLATTKDNITLKKISFKDDHLNHEETFYRTFNSVQSTEPPKAEKAPTEIQLELPSDQTFAPLSRASTTLSTAKITLDISSARNRDDDKITSLRKLPSKSEKRKTTTTPNTDRQPSRQTPRSRPITKDSRSRPVTRDRGTGLSVKTVKNAAIYVKKANVLKGVKLKPKAFKKNVKLIGVIRKPKRKHEEYVKGEKKDNHLVEAKPVSSAANTHGIQQTNVNSIDEPEPVSNKLQTTFIDIEDANFFMCSNETDDLLPVENKNDQRVEINHTSKLDQAIKTEVHRPQSPLVVKQMPAKHHKFVMPKFKNKQPPAFNFSAIVDKAKKVSKSNSNKLRIKRNQEDLRTESIVEQSAISSFIKDLKSSMKRTQRKKRQEMPALSRYARIPTLVNWVEYSDLLRTPSMQMQQRLSLDNDSKLIGVDST